MDLATQYRSLYLGALFAAETMEDGYRLGALDNVLKPWVRSELATYEHSLDHSDSRLDLADAVAGLTAIAPHYAELRRELFSDLHHFAPEPPWRPWLRKTMAIRAQSRVLHPQPTFILRRLDAGGSLGGVERWDFTVLQQTDPQLISRMVTLTATGCPCWPASVR